VCEAFGLVFDPAQLVNILLGALLGAAITLAGAWCASRELWTIFRALASVAEHLHPDKVRFHRDSHGRIKAARVLPNQPTNVRLS
jgi:hypothetical protein